MFVELGVFVASVLCIGYNSYRDWKTESEFIERKTNSTKLSSALPPPIEPSNPAVDLVVELFRSDEGWTRSYKTSVSHFEVDRATWTHESGVQFHSGVSTIDYNNVYGLQILDDGGKYKSVTISNSDGKRLFKEAYAYEDRKRNSREAELVRTLAQRIVSSVRPVLGGSSDNGQPKHSADDSKSPATAGLLTYDATAQQIVAPVRGDSVKLDMSASLRDRYGMSKSVTYDSEKGAYVKLSEALIAARNGSVFDYMLDETWNKPVGPKRPEKVCM